jgi:hypothetical protein
MAIECRDTKLLTHALGGITTLAESTAHRLPAGTRRTIERATDLLGYLTKSLMRDKWNDIVKREVRFCMRRGHVGDGESVK